MATHVQLRGLGATRTSPTRRHRHLRTMLVALPALLLTGLVGAAFAFGLDSIQGSISAYYLGPMRDVFVGCMVGIAVCLVAYRGEALEDYALNLAGFYALFVAFVPTQLAHSLAKLGTEQERADVIASLRVTIAAVLLVSAAFLTVEVRTGHWAYRELRKNTVTRWFFRISTVLAVAFIGLLVWRTLEGETFDNVHVAAAVLLIASMATAVASYAWPARTGSLRPPTAGSDKRSDRRRHGQVPVDLLAHGGRRDRHRHRRRAGVRVGVRRHHRGAVGAGAVRRVLAHPDPAEVGSADGRGAAAGDGRRGSRHLTPAPATPRRQRSASSLRAPTRAAPTATSAAAAIP